MTLSQKASASRFTGISTLIAQPFVRRANRFNFPRSIQASHIAHPNALAPLRSSVSKRRPNAKGTPNPSAPLCILRSFAAYLARNADIGYAKPSPQRLPGLALRPTPALLRSRPRECRIPSVRAAPRAAREPQAGIRLSSAGSAYGTRSPTAGSAGLAHRRSG